METKQTKIRLKRLAANDPLNAVRELDKLLDTDRVDTYNNLLILEGDIRDFQARSLIGLDSMEHTRQVRHDIIYRMLMFIDALEAVDFERTEWIQDQIYERILVATKNPERSTYLKQFFPAEYFPAIRFDHSQEKIDTREVDILIYDDHPSIKDHDDELLRYFIQDTDSIVLYFGRHSNLVWEYPEKAYATNSIFSLHARINEMIAYLKYRKAYQLQQRE